MKSVYLLLLLNRYCDEKPLFTAVILGHDTEGTDPMGRYIIQVVCVCVFFNMLHIEGQNKQREDMFWGTVRLRVRVRHLL